MINPASETEQTPSPSRPSLATELASVKLTVLTLSLLAATVLLGAWCPQESQVGREKIIEQFGVQTGNTLINLGVADIFHSPFFLALIAVLTVNMVACSFQRVFPKVRLLQLKMPALDSKSICKLPVHHSFECTAEEPLRYAANRLKRSGYALKEESGKLTAEFGKYGRLAATTTHIGLLTLLLGVTITSWTGFSGFKPILSGEKLNFASTEHSKLWIGKLPAWHVRVDSTRREDYPTGEPKQWYSDLSVISPDGKVLKQQQISVNNPLSFAGVDIYQSSWGLDSIAISFNGAVRKLNLRQMGNRYAAFLPLDQETIFIFSVKDQTEPLRLFAKRPDWESPKMIAEIESGDSKMLGSVKLTYEKLIPVTGLQYKCDPGLPVTYAAFAFIVAGVLLAAIPHRHVWLSVEPVSDKLVRVTLGGRSVKAKVGFERFMENLTEQMKRDCGGNMESNRGGKPLVTTTSTNEVNT